MQSLLKLSPVDLWSSHYIPLEWAIPYMAEHLRDMYGFVYAKQFEDNYHKGLTTGGKPYPYHGDAPCDCKYCRVAEIYPVLFAQLRPFLSREDRDGQAQRKKYEDEMKRKVNAIIWEGDSQQ